MVKNQRQDLSTLNQMNYLNQNNNRMKRPPISASNKNSSQVSESRKINQYQESSNMILPFRQEAEIKGQSSNLSSLQSTLQKNSYFNVNNQSMRRNTLVGAATNLNEHKEKTSPNRILKAALLEQQFKPYFMNSTHSQRPNSKNQRKFKNELLNQQLQETENSKTVIANKIIRFTSQGVKQSNTQRQLYNLNRQRKANDLINNYITSAPIPQTVKSKINLVDEKFKEANSQLITANSQLQNMPSNLKIQRDQSAPKVNTSSIVGGKRIRQYNKVLMDFQNKYYLKKTRPSHFTLSPEELYDENMQLKYKINQQDQFILLQKTQNKLLNNELEKQQELLKQLIASSYAKSSQMNSQIGNSSDQPFGIGQNRKDIHPHQDLLLINLKRELDIALKALALKEQEIKQLQKQTKVTKFREIDVSYVYAQRLQEERKAFMQESFRLHKIIKEMITKGFRGETRDQASYRQHHAKLQGDEVQYSSNKQEQFNIQSKNNEEFLNRISQYTLMIDQLQKQNSEAIQEVMNLKEQNYNLVSSNEQLQEQINLLTQSIKMLQQQKHEAELNLINLQKDQAHKLIPQVIKEIQYKTNETDEQKMTQLSVLNEELQLQNSQLQKSADVLSQKLQEEIQLSKQLNHDVEDYKVQLSTLQKGFEAEQSKLKIIYQENLSQMIKQNEQLLIQIQSQEDAIKDLQIKITVYEEKEKHNSEKENQFIARIEDLEQQLKQSQEVIKQPPMPKTLTPNKLKQSLIFSGNLEPQVEEYTQEFDVGSKLESQKQQNDDQRHNEEEKESLYQEEESGIQDNYGTTNLNPVKGLNSDQEYIKLLETNKLQMNDIEEHKLQLREANLKVQELTSALTAVNEQFQDAQRQLKEKQSEIIELELENQNKIQQIQEQIRKIQTDKEAEIEEVHQLFEEKQSELNEYKQIFEKDVQGRLKRYLRILQISEEKDLESFFFSNISNKIEELSPLDLLVMKFNFTQYEALVILEDILGLNVKTSSTHNLIQAMLEKFVPQELISNEQSSGLVKVLNESFQKYNMTMESFLTHYELENAKIVHHLILTKILQQIIPDNHDIYQLIQLLLGKSKNFTQIDLSIFRQLLGQTNTARFTNVSATQRSIKRTNSLREMQTSTQRLDFQESLGKSRLSNDQSQLIDLKNNQREDIKSEDEQDTEDQIQRALEGIMNKQHKQLNDDKLLSQIDSDNEDQQSILKLNMANNLASSEKSGMSQMTKTTNQFLTQQKQIKFLKNVQLQLIAQALNSQGKNLRRELQVYHTNQVEHLLGEEVEVIKMSDFMNLMRRLRVLTFEEGSEEDLQSVEMIEEMLIQIDSLFTIEALDQRVIILSKLVAGLQAFGYQDFPRPRSKKGLDFESLDVKSIRILNRIARHAQYEIDVFMNQFKLNAAQINNNQMRQISSQILESIVFKGCYTKVILKARNKEEKVLLIQYEQFYKRLKQLKIKMSDSGHQNLNKFLWLDQQYPQYLLFKKLVRVIELIQSNPYFESVGTQKLALEDETIIKKTSQINSKIDRNSHLGGTPSNIKASYIVDKSHQNSMHGKQFFDSAQKDISPVQNQKQKSQKAEESAQSYYEESEN